MLILNLRKLKLIIVNLLKAYVIQLTLFFFLSLHIFLPPASSPAKVQIEEYQLTVQQLRDGNYNEAIPSLRALINKHPDNIRIKADYLLSLVWSNSYSQAIEFYLAHEKQLESLPYVSRNCAKAYYELGNYLEAHRLYDTALYFDQNDKEAFKGAVYSLCRLDQYERALNLIENYIKKQHIALPLASSLKAHVFQSRGNNLKET